MNQSRNILVAIGITTSALFFASCSDAPKGDSAIVASAQTTAAAEGTTIAVDSAASTIRFVGNGVGKNHPGVFKIKEGAIAVAGNAVTGGQFTIDINSMELEEKGEMFDTKLRPHLLNADFLDAEKYPAAKFEITKVEPYTATGADTSVVVGANYLVSGNLTLKEVTKNITFPAKIVVSGNDVNAAANFDIDRTWWNINYGNDKSLGDKFISPTVNVQLNLQAKK